MLKRKQFSIAHKHLEAKREKIPAFIAIKKREKIK